MGEWQKNTNFQDKQPENIFSIFITFFVLKELKFIEIKELIGIRIIATIYLSFIMLATTPSTLYTLTHSILMTTHEQVLLFFLLYR